MKTQKKTFAIILVLLFSSMSLGIFNLVILSSANTGLPDYDYEPLRLDADFRDLDLPVVGEKLSDSSSIKTVGGLRTSAIAEGDYYEVDDFWWWLSLDNYIGLYFWAVFQLKAMNEFAEVWVQTDLSYGWGWDYEFNPITFADSRLDPVVSQEDIDYLLGEFSGNIVPTDSAIFGTPDFHDGENSGYLGEYNGSARNVILVSNIKDEGYYDETYPYYVAGFYSPSFENYFDRNIISIDSHQWEERVGPDGARPYLYEGVIAHEYQHLIHADWNPSDPSFMNEGCSMFAEYLCGYGVAWGDINSYMATPDNSLTEWGDQGGINILADYGVALLWAVYLNDRFGSEFLRDFVQAGIPGIAGLEELMDPYSFDEIYHDWRIANLIHSDWPGCGKYNYDTIDLGSEEADDIRVYSVTEKFPQFLGTDFGTTTTILGYDTGISEVSGYGSDYIKLVNPKGGFKSFFEFDGNDEATVPPLPTWVLDADQNGDGDDDWYSTTAGSEADLSLWATLDLTGVTNSILSFDTYFDIEGLWDFAFVQVSTDSGATWTSLANEYTWTEAEVLALNPDAYPAILDQLPGFTGNSGTWINMNFDLSAYTGAILIGFRYMTDWGFENPGWWIDNVQVLEGENGGEPAFNVDVFTFPPEPPAPEEDFMVTLIRASKWRGRTYYTIISDMHLNDVTEQGLKWAFPFAIGRADLFIIVTPLEGPADYEFSHYKRLKHSPWCH